MPSNLKRPGIVYSFIAALSLLAAARAWGTAYTATNIGVANWSSPITWSPNGVPGQNDTAEIRSGAVVVVDTNASTTVSCGGLIIDSGGALENVTTPGQSTLNLYGSLVNSNSGSAGFAAGGSSATKLVFVSGNVSWTGSGDTSAGKFYVTVNSGVTLNISGLTTGIKFKSGSGTTVFAVNGTLIGGTQVISANGNANNTFVLGASGTLQTANPNGIYVSGLSTPMLNYAAVPTLNAAANYVFNGSSAQVTAGLPSMVNNLTISNASGVTLSAACTVSGNLTLPNGQLRTTSANLLTMGASGFIAGGSASVFVSGPLAWIYSGPTPINKTFPIGTNGNYRAVSLSMTTLGTSPTTITVTPHEPSTLGGAASGGVSLFTNRDWTVASSPGSGNICTLTVDATGFMPVNKGVLVDYNGMTTNAFAATFASPNYTVPGISLTASSDFALGDCAPPVSSPTNIIVSAPGCSPVSVKWNSVIGAASYNVYRMLVGGSYEAAIGSSVTTNFSDPTAINGSNYVYAVSAAAACGGESVRCADSCVVVPASGAYVITQPASVTTGYNYTPTFRVTAINGYSNQWQISTNAGSTWGKVSTGSGGTTASYTTAFTTTNLSGYLYECVVYGCSGAVTSAPATLTILPYDQYEVLRQAWQSNLFNNGASLTSIASKANGYWSTMDTNISRTYLWSDLPLGTDSGNIVSTFNRLQSMALAWAMPGCSLQGNVNLASVVANGLDWLNANVYTANTNQPQYSGGLNNWYDWEISGPLSLNDTVVLMYPALTGTQVSNYCAAVDNFGPDGKTAQPYFNWANLTGANTADVVLNMILRGILGKNSAKLNEARTNLSPVLLYVTGGDGFYPDGSFVFHGNIAYNGHYGFVLLQDVPAIVNLLQGSTWQITDPNLANVYDWVFNSFAPLIYNGAMMDMTRGRAISWSSSTEYDDGAKVIAAVNDIARFAPAATTQALRNWASAPQLPPGQFHFGAMDRVVALRSGFGFGLSLSSSRIANYENLFSSSNLKGWFTGDGMTYLYLGNSDTQFTGDFWPTVDYYHLPGTTAETNSTPQPSTTDQSWVGGAQVGNTYGVAGMAQHADSTTLYAKKSWFMLDNEIVCLGAGITCGDSQGIDTTVENRRLGASPTNHFWVNGADIAPVIGWSSNLTSASWCALDGVGGYYFPGGATNLRASFVSGTGLWTQINPSDKNSTLCTDSYLKLYFNHGVRPTNSTYAYVLLPNLTASSVSNYAAAPDIIVLTNTPTVQAVSKPSLGVVAANFWTAGSNSADLISVSAKASVITRQTSNILSVGISDPTQVNPGAITVTLDCAASDVLSADPEVTVVQLAPRIILSVAVGDALGKAFQASFASPMVITNTTPPTITSFGIVGASGQFRIQFAGNSSFSQTVLGTTNLSLPLTNWQVLGVATQISSGVFEFTDLNATSNVPSFYRLRSP